MSYVRVKGFVGSPEKARVEEVNFLVDTGAYYTVLPPELTDNFEAVYL